MPASISWVRCGAAAIPVRFVPGVACWFIHGSFFALDFLDGAAFRWRGAGAASSVPGVQI